VRDDVTRKGTSVLLVAFAVGLIAVAWLLNPLSFDNGGWRRTLGICIGTFYAFFRVRGETTWLGPVALTPGRTRGGIMLYADLAAGFTFLVGLYKLFAAE